MNAIGNSLTVTQGGESCVSGAVGRASGMNRRLAMLLLAAALSGCATFNDTELASVRGRGVSPAVMSKLDRGRALAPADVIELTRRGVPDAWIIRQLEDHDVDSLVSKSDLAALRRAGVRPAVIDSVLNAEARFVEDYRYGPSSAYWWGYGDPYYGYYNGAYDWPGYGGVGATFDVRCHDHHGHHHHHH